MSAWQLATPAAQRLAERLVPPAPPAPRTLAEYRAASRDALAEDDTVRSLGTSTAVVVAVLVFLATLRAARPADPAPRRGR